MRTVFLDSGTKAMGVFLLLCISAVLMSVSCVDARTADHEPALTDRLDALERLLETQQQQWHQEKRRYERLELEWEESKRQWEQEKIRYEKLELDWQNTKQLLLLDNRDLKRALTELMERVKKLESAPVTEPIVSNVHDVRLRADDAGAWEPVVSQMSQQLNQVTADIGATKDEVASVKSEMAMELQAVRDVNVQQDQAIQESRASVFVRWGRTVCPDSDSLVYSGVVGGSNTGHTGAAANFLCLSLNPVFSSHPMPPYFALLYGAEYETSDAHMPDNPPCAVCRSPRPTTMMVPGTNQCPAGWTLEYSGFLVANYYQHVAASEYICLDSAMEDRPSSQADEPGKLLYLTVTRCGSLPCPPYANDKIVTCAVCSK